ncbi:MAG: gliding motility-associated C-terminal domain-containing protein [Bacteroidota bacterium]
MQIRLSVLLMFMVTSIFGQENSLRGPLDTLNIADGCELIVPKLCDRHDYWLLESTCEFESFELQVFDRWGKLVFGSDSIPDVGFALAHSHSRIISGQKHVYNPPGGDYVWIIRIKSLNATKRTLTGKVRIEQFIE